MSVKISHSYPVKPYYLRKNSKNNLNKEIIGLFIPTDFYKDTLMDTLEIIAIPNKFINLSGKAK